MRCHGDPVQGIKVSTSNGIPLVASNAGKGWPHCMASLYSQLGGHQGEKPSLHQCVKSASLPHGYFVAFARGCGVLAKQLVLPLAISHT